MTDPTGRTSFRILVTGSRHCTDEQVAIVQAQVQDVVLHEWSTYGHRPVVIVHGQCPYGGVDLAAHQWADRTDGVNAEAVPADWDLHGKAAGPIRNAEMVHRGADICVAFPVPGSRGTWDCVRKAADAGIPVQVWPLTLHRALQVGP